MAHSLRVLALGALISMTGCVYNGNVSFVWTFNGGQTCEQAQVSLVQLQVGGILATVSCRDFYTGVPGATLVGVPSGTQSWTLTGLSCVPDAFGNCVSTIPIYQSTGLVSILSGGTVQVPPVDLPPIGAPANSNITFLWSFVGKTCAQAAVANVTIQVTDPASPVNQTVPCTQNGVDGASVNMFTVGTYPFTLTALDTSAQPVYAASGSVALDGFNSLVVHVDLGSLTGSGAGSLTILWTFGGQSCSAAGVANIHYSLRDTQGAIVSGVDQTDTCANIGSGISIGSLTTGNYWLEAQGQNGSGQVNYVLNPYQVYVSPGGTSTYTPNLVAK